MLLALQEAQPVDRDAALLSDSLLQMMLAAGVRWFAVVTSYNSYEQIFVILGVNGSGKSTSMKVRSKLRTCLASLHGTHEAIKRSNTGYYYLTDNGQRSAELCLGSPTRSSTNEITYTYLIGA